MPRFSTRLAELKKKKMKNGEIQLPEEVIQHIQSFLSGKEAARTAILSKSWYAAWLTRPTIDLDQYYFSYRSPQSFEEIVNKTMRRYRDSILKIDSFRLCGTNDGPSDIICYHTLVADAIKMGATDLQLALPRSFTLREEVLGSETLLRLSVRCCEIDGKYLSFSRLKSLSLESLIIRDGTISCCNSLEELSLTTCRGLKGQEVNLDKLRKLRFLCLNSMYVNRMNFTEFASRFPCLKDFALSSYFGRHKIDIASTSLQTITFKDLRLLCYVPPYANFNVPNIKVYLLFFLDTKPLRPSGIKGMGV